MAVGPPRGSLTPDHKAFKPFARNRAPCRLGESESQNLRLCHNVGDLRGRGLGGGPAGLPVKLHCCNAAVCQNHRHSAMHDAMDVVTVDHSFNQVVTTKLSKLKTVLGMTPHLIFDEFSSSCFIHFYLTEVRTMLYRSRRSVTVRQIGW